MSGEGYWLIREDSPPTEVTIRVQGWDGETPNPYCFNCLHTLARHWKLEAGVNSSEFRKQGGECKCDYEGCICQYYLPSYIDDVL